MTRPNKASTTPATTSAPRASDPARSPSHAWTSIFDMPLDELQRRTDQAGALMIQAIELLPGLRTMTADERKHSGGRLRSGEGAVYLDVLSIVEDFPAFFASLADLDEGVDPTKVETTLMRDRIQRAEVLAPLVGLLGKFGGISDTVLLLRGLVRQPVTEAYGIAKSLARTNATLRSRLAKTIDYYASIAKSAAATRKANALAKPQEGGLTNGAAAKG